jgi:hypothetical protein
MSRKGFTKIEDHFREDKEGELSLSDVYNMLAGIFAGKFESIDRSVLDIFEDGGGLSFCVSGKFFTGISGFRFFVEEHGYCFDEVYYNGDKMDADWFEGFKKKLLQ